MTPLTAAEFGRLAATLSGPLRELESTSVYQDALRQAAAQAKDAERWKKFRGLVQDESKYSVWHDGERLTLLELQSLDAHVDAQESAK